MNETPLQEPPLNLTLPESRAVEEETRLFRLQNNAVLRRLHLIGSEKGTVGTARIDAGAIMLTQVSLIETAAQLKEHLDKQLRKDGAEVDVEMVSQFARALAYISGHVIRATKISAELSGRESNPAQNSGKLKRKSFAPSSVVQNNYYGDKKPPETPPAIVLPPEE